MRPSRLSIFSPPASPAVTLPAVTLPALTLLALTLCALTPLSHADPIGSTPVPAATSSAKVVIAGKRVDVINEVDRKVYRTDTDLQASSGSAADILNNLPSVELDMDGNLSLRGNTDVTVLIDGRPSGQMQGKNRGAALQGFAAADIQQIEVITSPSAEFNPDGSGGIINIVTRKNRKLGRSSVLVTNLGNNGRRNANLSSSVNADGFNLDGNLDLRTDYRERELDYDTNSSVSGSGGATHSHQSEQNEKNRVAGKIGLKYSPDKQRKVGMSFDYARRDDQRARTEHVMGSAGTASYDRIGKGGEPRVDGSASLSFEQKLAQDGEALSFYLQRSHSLEAERLTLETFNAGSANAASRELNHVEQIFDMHKLTAAYVYPYAADSVLKLGYDMQVDNRGFNNASSNAPGGANPGADPAFDSQFRYHQQVNALYATLSKKLQKFELLGGLRFEQVDIQTRQLVSGDSSQQSYAKLYPTLNLVYSLGENDVLTAGLSKRIRKPDAEDLNPYINAADPNNLRQGNPNLKPQITDALEIGHRHDVNGQSYSVTAYYRRSSNGDTDILTPLGNNVVLFTKANLPLSQSGGLEFTTSGKLLPTLNYNASGNAFYNQINAQVLGGAATRSSVAFNTKATLNYQPMVTDKWQASANYRGKRLTPQGEIFPVATMNIGYRRQWSSELALVATVADLFNSQRDRRIYQTPTFVGTYRRHQTGQVAYVGLVYTFEGSKSPRNSDFNYE